MARLAAIHGFCQDREARGNADNIELVASSFDQQLGAAWFWRRKKNAVGGAGDILFGSENANVTFDFVVIRRDLFVGDGPIVAEAVSRAGFEINWRKTQGNAAPMIGAAADDARPKPLEIRTGCGGVRLAFDVPRAVGSEKFAEI